MSFRIGGFLAVLCSAVVFTGCVDNSDPADSGVPPAWPHGGAAFDEKYGNGDGLNFDPASYQEGAGDYSIAGDDWVEFADRRGFPTVYYAYDSEALNSSETAKLDFVVDYMIKNPEVLLTVKGHCDERGTEEYNRTLGERRAISVKDYLANAGIDDSRMRTLSFGKDQPAVEGTGEAVWAQNRRAELWPAVARQ